MTQIARCGLKYNPSGVVVSFQLAFIVR